MALSSSGDGKGSGRKDNGPPLRDPPPVWDGVNPADRWERKRREILAWADDCEIADEKKAVRFWRFGVPDDSPARTIIDTIPDDALRKADGMKTVMA